MTQEEANQLKDGDPVFVVLDSAMVEVAKFVEDEVEPGSIRVRSDIFKTVSLERAFSKESFAWVYIYDKLNSRIQDCRERLKGVRDNIAKASRGYDIFALRRKMNGQCILCGKPSVKGKVLCESCAGGKGRVKKVWGIPWGEMDWEKPDLEIAEEIGVHVKTVRKNRKRLGR